MGLEAYDARFIRIGADMIGNHVRVRQCVDTLHWVSGWLPEQPVLVGNGSEIVFMRKQNDPGRPANRLVLGHALP